VQADSLDALDHFVLTLAGVGFLETWVQRCAQLSRVADEHPALLRVMSSPEINLLRSHST
jgi:hypothetical protein